MGLSIDVRSFQEAIKFVTSVTPRTCADALNRAGKTAIIGAKGVKGAMQLTPKADRAAIRKVSDKEIAGYVAAKLRKTGKLAARGAKRTKGQFSKAQFKNAIRFERQRRIRAAGYTAFAGWSNAAKAFGGKGVKGVTSSTKKLAKHGKGKKATSNDLVATLSNTAPASEDIGFEALQQGVNNAAADMVAYGTKKLQETFDKVKAR